MAGRVVLGPGVGVPILGDLRDDLVVTSLSDDVVGDALSETGGAM